MIVSLLYASDHIRANIFSYKFKCIVEKALFLICLKKKSNVIKEWNVIWSACLEVKPITVYSCRFLLNSTTVGQIQA